MRRFSRFLRFMSLSLGALALTLVVGCTASDRGVRTDSPRDRTEVTSGDHSSQTYNTGWIEAFDP